MQIERWDVEIVDKRSDEVLIDGRVAGVEQSGSEISILLDTGYLIGIYSPTWGKEQDSNGG